jgi:hypothetical protein
MEWLSKLTELHKVPTRYVGVLAIVTGAILFSPVWFLDRLHLSTIPSPYGGAIGVVFLATSGLVVINLIGLIFDSSKLRGRSKRRQSLTKKAMSQLDPAEQAILREFMLTGLSTLKIPMDDPSVAGLSSKGILELTGRYGDYSSDGGMMFPFSLSTTAKELLTPELLGLSRFVIECDSGQFDLTQEGRDWVEDHRPDFVESRRRRW